MLLLLTSGESLSGGRSVWGRSVQRKVCPGESLSRGRSVWGRSVQRKVCPRRGLSRRRSVQREIHLGSGDVVPIYYYLLWVWLSKHVADESMRPVLMVAAEQEDAILTVGDTVVKGRQYRPQESTLGKDFLSYVFFLLFNLEAPPLRCELK